MMRLGHPRKIRPTALLLVLLAHVPLVLLFAWGWRVSRDEPELPLVFVGLWQQMRPPRAPELPGPAPSPSRTRAAPAPRDKPQAPVESAELPSPVITLPTEAAPSSAPPGPAIDWHAEGVAAAARQAAPGGSTTFSAPPKTVHKACEKKKSSWEWNKQPQKAGVTKLSNGLPLPYVAVGRCVIGLGFFGCALQKPPEANSHLLDDMHAGKTSPSSVPDPDTCD
jgi:hypothetical protein